MQVYGGSDVLDCTYGRGNFWTDELKSRINLVSVDAYTPASVKADYRHLPFRAESFDVVVFDPPYAKRPGTSMKESIASPFGLATELAPMGNLALMQDYYCVAEQALSLLRPRGILILKCQDEIESGKQRFNHVPLLSIPGYICEDLFVLVQQGIPAMRVPYQLHARKNHSYFVVQRKRTSKS